MDSINAIMIREIKRRGPVQIGDFKEVSSVVADSIEAESFSLSWPVHSLELTNPTLVIYYAVNGCSVAPFD